MAEAEANTAGSMRQALWLVRQALVSVGISPMDLLDIEGDTVGIRMDAEIDLDTAALERCLDATGCGPEEAISRYHGDLLEGLGHDCFATERERLADRYEDALAVVAEQRLEAGDLDGARIAADAASCPRPVAGGGARRPHRRPRPDRVALAGRPPVPTAQRVLSRELGEPPLPDTEAIYRHALAQTMRRAQERAALIEPDRRQPLVAVGR